MSTKGAESAQKALRWQGPSKQSGARKRTRLDSSHSLRVGDSFQSLIVTIPAQDDVGSLAVLVLLPVLEERILFVVGPLALVTLWRDGIGHYFVESLFVYGVVGIILDGFIVTTTHLKSTSFVGFPGL